MALVRETHTFPANDPICELVSVYLASIGKGRPARRTLPFHRHQRQHVRLQHESTPDLCSLVSHLGLWGGFLQHLPASAPPPPHDSVLFSTLSFIHGDDLDNQGGSQTAILCLKSHLHLVKENRPVPAHLGYASQQCFIGEISSPPQTGKSTTSDSLSGSWRGCESPPRLHMGEGRVDC